MSDMTKGAATVPQPTEADMSRDLTKDYAHIPMWHYGLLGEHWLAHGCAIRRAEYERRRADKAELVAASRAGADPELRTVLLHEFGTTEPEGLAQAARDWRERAAEWLAARDAFRCLLAVIFGDGGHRVSEKHNGDLVAASMEARERWCDLRTSEEDLERHNLALETDNARLHLRLREQTQATQEAGDRMEAAIVESLAHAGVALPRVGQHPIEQILAGVVAGLQRRASLVPELAAVLRRNLDDLAAINALAPLLGFAPQTAAAASTELVLAKAKAVLP